MEKLNTQFIEKRLKNIAKYRQRLDSLLEYNDKMIKIDMLKQHTLERLIQLIVDEMIDINEYIIKVRQFDSPDDFQGTFRLLGEHDILPLEFAESLSPIVGLRNLIVHRYEEIDLDLLIQTARNRKDDFKIYVSHILEFLNRQKLKMDLRNDQAED